jgi:hypothetical protein
MTNKIIEKAFKPLRKLPCWQAERGYGSFLTMEFGNPSLEIREPKKPLEKVSIKVKKVLERRNITVKGDWHLWIYCCDWGVFEGNDLIGDCSKKKSMDRAAAQLNGQMLKKVRVYKNGRTDFKFEYGTLLMTRPYDKDSEQWMLFEPNGNVLTFKADGNISYQPADTPTEKIKWKNI